MGTNKKGNHNCLVSGLSVGHSITPHNSQRLINSKVIDTAEQLKQPLSSHFFKVNYFLNSFT